MNSTHTPCPDPSRLAAWLDGRVDPPEREALLAHALECPECSELVSDVLGASGGERALRRPLSAPARWTWAAAAVVVIAVGAFAFWLRADSGEASYRQALAAALDPASQSDAALWFHPPAGVPTTGLPQPRVLRGATTTAPCGPGTNCGRALDEARRRSSSPLRLRLDPRAAQIFLAASALDLETAYQAREVIRDNDWVHAQDPSLRVAACLVLALVGLDSPEDVAATLAAVDPSRIEDLATLFNLARLAHLTGDSARECAAWRAYLARAPASPWRSEAQVHAEACPAG